MTRLDKQFFEIPTLALTRLLLGKIFLRELPGGLVLKARIVETEAYLGQGDEACHAWRGKTRRNQVMFDAPGRMYIYFTYGCHHLMNIVTEPEGVAGAVLIRAMEPLSGMERMQELRAKSSFSELMSGPAKLTQALGIDTSNNGQSLLSGPFGIHDAPDLPDSAIASTTRIGITRSTNLPWRMFIRENPHVSKGKPS